MCQVREIEFASARGKSWRLAFYESAVACGQEENDMKTSKLDHKTANKPSSASNPFLTLDAVALKAAFEQRDAAVRKLLGSLRVTFVELNQLLSEVRGLLDQSGAERLKTMEAAGLPLWMKYFEFFVKELCVCISGDQKAIEKPASSESDCRKLLASLALVVGRMDHLPLCVKQELERARTALSVKKT
jgi:hypothetical protein